jgi:hypothetical protein
MFTNSGFTDYLSVKMPNFLLYDLRDFKKGFKG